MKHFDLKSLVCSWDWEKMTSEEKVGRNVCRCWNGCPVLQKKRQDRIANAKGFWARLAAKLF